jgi:hypothetical protein
LFEDFKDLGTSGFNEQIYINKDKRAFYLLPKYHMVEKRLFDRDA